MSSNRVNPTPLIGRAGVVLVAADIAAGALVLPVAALLREFVIPRDVPLAAPEQINELGRLALWVSAALAGALWPIALRAVDPGYPSAQLPIRRVLVAATTWLLSVSGAIYLLDKNLESRALVVIATLLLLSVALLVRRSNHTGSPDKLGPESPLLSECAQPVRAPHKTAPRYSPRKRADLGALAPHPGRCVTRIHSRRSTHHLLRCPRWALWTTV